MILTDGDKMVTTPTYHVYDIYQSHQGGQSLRSTFESEDLSFDFRAEPQTVPALSGSASIKDNVLTLSVVNASYDSPIEASIQLNGAIAKGVTALTLAHEDAQAHNTFDAPDKVTPVTSQVAASSGEWVYTFPAASVTVLRVQL
jgi:alpha-N-arabinofuranosidase